jgi:hypothetical protein
MIRKKREGYGDDRAGVMRIAWVNSRIHQQIRNLDYFTDGLHKIDLIWETIVNKLENPSNVQTDIFDHY